MRRSGPVADPAAAPSEPGLWLRLAGEFAVRRGGRILAATEVGSRKARTLLALLAVERGRLVTADRIAEVLWAGAPPRQPADNVATLVSRLRAALGSTVVTGGRTGYRLGDSVRDDLHDAALMVTGAEARLAGREPSLALMSARRALTLLDGGDVLADEPDSTWVEPARFRHGELLRRARHAAAESALTIGDLRAARDAADAALATDPLDEVAGRALMRAHDAAHEPARALIVYEDLRATLGRELGVDPASATQDLHVAILRGTAAPPADPASPAVASPAEGSAIAGRDKDLARLSDAWAAAGTGRPRVLLIAGEAGIGKTRLAEELVRLARRTGGLVAQSRCYESERSLFLQPVAEALTHLVSHLPYEVLKKAAGDRAGALAALLPEVAAVLGPSAVEHGTADAERRRSYDAVVSFLRRVCVERPVVLVLDDLHNAGAATVDLLHYLARNVAGARLLVLATVREEEGRETLATLADVAERMDVGPLDTQAIARLAAAEGRGSIAAEIERRTRGHTLFVVETLRGLNAGEPAVPESLRASVLSRVRRAGAQAEDLLRAAAVVGASFSPATVAGLLDIGEHEAARRCERILTTRLVVVAGRSYEFANDLIQSVLYDTTPVPTRVAYHRRAANLLTANPEAVGWHAVAAEDWPRAARGWLAAGERALRRYAVRDAEVLLDRALTAARLAADVGLEGRALLARGRTREAMFRYDDALADYEAAARVAHAAGDRRLEMNALRELGGPAWAGAGRSVVRGADHLAEGLRLATVLGDRGAESDLLGWLAVLAANRLRFDDALGYGRRALAAARLAADDRALAAALDGLKSAYAHLGELDQLRTVLDELEPLVGRLGDLWLMQWCVLESAFPMIGAGAWDAAANRIREALAVNRRSGYTGYESGYVAYLGWLARLAGRLDEAVIHGRRALNLDSHAWVGTAAASMLATTLLETGESAEAIRLLEQALAACDQHRTTSYRLRCLAPLADATGSRALLDEADAMVHAIRAPDGSAWLYGADAYVAIARAWTSRGNLVRAAQILAPLLAAGRRTGWVAPLASARALADRCRPSTADVR